MSLLKPDYQDFQNLQKQLIEALGPQFQVELESVIEGLPFIKERFDLVILKDGEPVAALNYMSLFQSVDLHNRQDWYTKRFKNVGIKKGILFFGKNDEFHLYSKGKSGLTSLSFNGLIAAIKGDNSFGDKPLIDDVATDILSCMPEEMSNNIDISRHQELSALFTEDNLIFDNNCGTVCFSEKAENDFFRILLPQRMPQSLCRYTSLNSLYYTLNSKRHCLCSITCMNDKGEISYADKYIHYGVYAYSQQVIENNNNCFILSCCESDKLDDLTMWRLYGDQGRGVCLEYKSLIEKADNKQFFMAPISYGESKDKHLELDFIKGINNWKKDGWYFKFNQWNIWKHFFKSYLFKDEHEYRILFLSSEDSKAELRWIMDSTNSIISRIALFDVEDENFPLELKSILVGPKCPEQESNVDQLAFMNHVQCVITSQEYQKVVKTSNITDYR